MPQASKGEIKRDVIRGVASASLLFALSLVLPLVGCLFLPLPILFYRVKLGRKPGAVVLGATVFLFGSFVSGVNVYTLFLFGLLLEGFFIGECFSADLPADKTLLYSAGLVFGLGLAGFILYSGAAGGGIREFVAAKMNELDENFAYMIANYERIGTPAENIQRLREFWDIFSGLLRQSIVPILPALIASTMLMAGWISLLTARPIFARKNLPYPGYAALNQWRSPEGLVWGVIACAVMWMLPQDGLRFLGKNGLIVLMTVYFFQGIAIVSFFFEKRGFPRILKIFMYSIIAMQQLVLLLVIGLGFFDMWINFRKLDLENGTDA